MIKGARKLPTQHITIRVPWHDSSWNGTVCKNACANTSCMVLPRIAESRDDVLEIKLAGMSLEHLERDQHPACIGEHATFMAPFQQTLLKVHPYSESAKTTHGHFKDTFYYLQPFAAAAVPFRWMLKTEVEGDKKVSGKAENLRLGYVVESEPDMRLNGWENSNTSWIQEGHNQRVLLDTFFSAIEPEESLVFFYAKRTPLSEEPGRVIVGVGRVKQVGNPTEYRYSENTPPGSMSGFLWERNIHHSIRQNCSDGFLLPYHQLLELNVQDPSIDIDGCIAFAPSEAFDQYSYGSEILTQDNSIASLLACEKALKATRALIEGPWDKCLSWIDQELNRLWQVRGAFPGMGAALNAFGISHGNLLAWYLTESENKEAIVDPWPKFDAVLNDPSVLPQYLQENIGLTLAKKWQQLPAERKQLLKLISRFVLTDEQAKRWFQQDQREKSGITIPDTEILNNPYSIYEADRTQENPVAFTVIDRGLFPPEVLRIASPVPKPSHIAEDIDPRRVRALLIWQLEEAAKQGHTFLPESWIVQWVRKLTLQPICPLDNDLMPIFDDFLDNQLELLIAGDGQRAYQLKRYIGSKECIASALKKRLKAKTLSGDYDWADLVNKAIENAPDRADWDNLESVAREEKALALEMIYRTRISVLMGAAGTGKSTLIKALCRIPGVQSEGVLLLAPTGKARVRLEQASGMPGKGQTVAQFLNKLKRYDGSTRRYFMNPSAAKSMGHKTVVIDESSMLTEDQLAALIDSFESVDRLILVGDPKQLPPIGAGRPFVDIVNEVRPDNIELNNRHRVAPGYAELCITRRQQGQRLDLQLANYFNGSDVDPGQDEIWSRLRTEESEHIRLIQWQTPEQLQTLLLAAVREELKLDTETEQVDFACSIGGTLHNKRAYFWPGKDGKPGAASKAESWQILSPLRTLQAGSDAINRMIQNHFRSSTLELAAESIPWKRFINRPMGVQSIIWGDKVINVKNDDSRDTWPKQESPYVANGDIGIVTGSFKTKYKKLFKNLEVEFSTQQGIGYKYKPWEFDGEKGNAPLELAYALTVHKTQGSEFGVTFLVIPNPCKLLSREMLYTAITRQKEKVVVLYQGDLTDLHQYSLDSASEVKRRLTNLFRQSVPVEYISFNKPSFLDKNLIYLTHRGELVRSKTEWIIADKLFSAGINYHYEKPIELNGNTRYPDFIIVDDDSGITWYWEHLGLMNNDGYITRWQKKLDLYTNANIHSLDKFDAEKSKGILITTIEDGIRVDLSKQISDVIEIIKRGPE